MDGFQKKEDLAVVEQTQYPEARRPLAGDGTTSSRLHRQSFWHRTQRLFLDTWFPEIGAVIVATIAWFSVLALLCIYREVSKDIGEAIFHHGADMFPQSIANISTVVTNHIWLRSYEWVFGTAELRTPHVRFRWAWLLLPLAGLLATAVLLVATVYQTRRLRLPCWKASVLPAMQYGTKFVEAEAEEEGDAPALVTVSRLSEYAATRRGTVKGQPVGLSVT